MAQKRTRHLKRSTERILTTHVASLARGRIVLSSSCVPKEDWL
jgi:hypothetical protein